MLAKQKMLSHCAKHAGVGFNFAGKGIDTRATGVIQILNPACVVILQLQLVDMGKPDHLLFHILGHVSVPYDVAYPCRSLADDTREIEVALCTMPNNSILDRVCFRDARPTDIPSCYEIEKASYPPDEAASLSTLQYRQHHVAPYFRCAILVPDRTTADGSCDDSSSSTVVGYICSTRCRAISAASLTTHIPSGPLLAIHSIAVHPTYRRLGVATHLLRDFIETVDDTNHRRGECLVQKIVLLAKAPLLCFYLNAGFTVVRPSAVTHGADLWYDVELNMMAYSNNNTADSSHQLAAALPCYIVDSFCNAASPMGTGKPAAVVVCNTALSNDDDAAMRQWMQQVAAEFHISETAFVWRMETPPPPEATETATIMSATTATSSTAEPEEVAMNGKTTATRTTTNGALDETTKDLHYGIRYYTPSVEVPLCGHATLAAAAVLYQTVPELLLDTKHELGVVFYARRDVLRNKQRPSGRDPWPKLTVEFPQKWAQPLQPPDACRHMVQAALNVAAADIRFMGLTDTGDVLVEVTHDAFVGVEMVIDKDAVDYGAFLEWDGYTRGVIVCCEAPKRLDEAGGDESTGNNNNEVEVDFFSRFFAPKAGINEDPGSAHCVLAPYFGKKLNKDQVVGHQRSKRGGIVDCQLVRLTSTVKLTGSAFLVVSGTLWMKR
jgi:predicted PhzF superfamily epimerase YddE/YHI9/ribosomal protein S18 acetylase RimI-like enzyme